MSVTRVRSILLVLMMFLSVAVVVQTGAALTEQAAAAVIGDNYPANLKNAAQDSLIDQWRFYNRECTSFVAWRLNSQNKVGFTDYYGGPQWGDASNWGPTARRLGIPVNNTPAVGSVAWSPNGDHVAWVAAVGAGSVTIEEYNYDYHGHYNTRTVATSTFQYIHISDLSGAVSNGSFIQVSGHAEIYRVVGGAPLYVSSWSAFGGAQPVSVVSPDQFNSLNSVPSNGTFISDASNGRVYEIAGGAPLYISGGDAANVPGYNNGSSVVAVDPYDLAHYDHLRPVPANGTFISNVDNGRVYEVAGGAPLYISAADASQVPGYNNGTSVVTTSGYEFAAYEHLRAVPANGTFISNVDDGRVYEVAGGAPLYISAADASQVPGYNNGTSVVTTSGYEFAAYEHLRAVPANGTFISNVDDGRVYKVAGGAPLYVTGTNAAKVPGYNNGASVVATSDYEFDAFEHLKRYPTNGTYLISTAGGLYEVVGGSPLGIGSWANVGGERVATTVDQWVVTHRNSSLAHLRVRPAAGTTVLGRQSKTAWTFSGSCRVSARTATFLIADYSFTTYPVCLRIATASLSHATRGKTYRAVLHASGGTSRYTWSLTLGKLPAGLRMSAAGLITGKPSRAGTFVFTATVRDSARAPQSRTKTFSIKVTS